MRAYSNSVRPIDSEKPNPNNIFRASLTAMIAGAGRVVPRLRIGRGRLAGILSDESGQALVLAAMCLTFLMGALALAIDVGNIHYQERKLQTAADSAAIAAGLELGNCSDTVCANMKTAAADALVEDGITTATVTPSSNCTVSNTSTLSMIINVAPCVLGTSDPNNGNAHMAEVVLTAPQSTFFGAIFGIPKMNMVARAEAGDSYISTINSGGNCVYTNNLEFNSSDGTFTMNNCGIYDGGNLQTDNGDSVTASNFLYYGTWNPNNCNGGCSWALGGGETQPTHTTTPETDPLASLTAPSQPSASTTASNTAPTSNATLQPGYYANTININPGITVNLTPGLYSFGSGSSINVDGTLECTTCTGGAGVTLYFSGGTIQPNSSATIELTAPSSGSTSNGNVANMLIWESSTDSAGLTIDASSSNYYNGVIYLPDGTLTLNSGSGTTINNSSTATALDANNIIVNAGVNFVINGSGGYLGGSSSKTLGSFAVSE
jgi:Flp pilus assembly protein TadG